MLTPAIMERKFFKPNDWTASLLKNDSLVPGAARYSLAIQIFQQRNGVFARNARQRLELRHVDQSLWLVF
jgi:hypothetical protein